MLSCSSYMAQFVQQHAQNEQILNNRLAENISDVTESLGGLSNIIQLCLTNPHASNAIDSDKFESFVAILVKYGISSQNNLDNIENNEIKIVYDSDNDETDIPVSPTSIMSDYDMNNKQIAVERVRSIDSSDINTINTTNNRTSNQHHLITNLNVENLNEYYKSRFTIDAKVEDKIVFKLLGQDGYIQKLVTSEIVLYLLTGSAVLGFIIAFTLLLVDGPNMPYIATLAFIFCVAIIVEIIALLNAHKMLYSLTLNTFDFWFILWNAINVIVSRIALGIYNHQLVWYSILRTVGSFSTAITLVCMDAIHISKQFKVITRAMIFLYFSFVVLSFYFSGKDVEWNPFESYGIKESNISFKSVYLSSTINIILFSFKPLFKDIYRLFRKRICATLNDSDSSVMSTIHSVSDSPQVNNKNCQRCDFLYKRPYVRWRNKQRMSK